MTWWVKFQRNRQKKKEALEAGEGDDEAVSKETPSAVISYVDRDRAAAVGMEKDIKSNLKVIYYN